MAGAGRDPTPSTRSPTSNRTTRRRSSCRRRSFASYHYAQTGDDTATRFILGHIGRVEVFIRHYRSVDIIENGDLRPLARADARDYWFEIADLIAQFASQDDTVGPLICAHAA